MWEMKTLDLREFKIKTWNCFSIRCKPKKIHDYNPSDNIHGNHFKIQPQHLSSLLHFKVLNIQATTHSPSERCQCVTWSNCPYSSCCFFFIYFSHFIIILSQYSNIKANHEIWLILAESSEANTWSWSTYIAHSNEDIHLFKKKRGHLIAS